MAKTINDLKDIEERLRSILDDPYEGLRQTSNTNKSRNDILALFNEQAKHYEDIIKEKH